MNTTHVSVRYARALFELARQSGELASTDQWLTHFSEETKRYPKMSSLMQNPIIATDEKNAFLEKLFPAGTPALLKNFLKVLVEKRRFLLFPEIRDTFHAMFERQQGILEVELLSATPFSEKLQEKLKQVLGLKLRSEIRIVPRTEPSLLGGFLLRFAGKEIDCSFKNRFYEIEQQLLTC
jgi:F-type H+-transporting ATPase subunit delta